MVLFTMLLDIIQLGLYFSNAQSIYGGGDCKSMKHMHILSFNIFSIISSYDCSNVAIFSRVST